MKNRLLSLVPPSVAMFASLSFALPPDPIPEVRALAAKGEHDAAAAGFKAYLDHNRFDAIAWYDYGYELHSAKHFDEAIAAWKTAISLGGRPAGSMYNIACAHAMSGRKDDAIQWLTKSLDAGFPEQQTLESDSEVDSLRDDPRFIELTGLKPPAGLSRDKQWEWDLNFFARRMKQMHWDLYAKVSKETFATEVQRLIADAPTLPDSQVRVRLSRILAMVGDGHTALAGTAVDQRTLARFPLHLFRFNDGLYIMGAAKEQESLVGSRVVRIGGLDADAAMKALEPYCSVDNTMGYLAAAPARLTNPAMLVAIGAAQSETEARFTLAPPGGGSPSEVTLTAVELPAGGGGRLFTPGFTYAHQSAPAKPLYLANAGKPFAMISVPESKLLYVWFAAVQNDQHTRLADFFKQVFDTIEKAGVERLVIDMRFNGGGNTGLVEPLIHGLIRCERISKPGQLFVIIGRHTFSAAQNTVNMIELHTRATFVGEPTGSRPNFVGESTFFVLPYSKARVHCSSRYWQFNSSVDQREWVQPQITAEMSFADYAAGRDPAMEAILKAIGK